jgi:hypothetical protein
LQNQTVLNYDIRWSSPTFSNKIKVCDLGTICFSGCITNETLDLDLSEKHKKITYINQKYIGHGFSQ